MTLPTNKIFIPARGIPKIISDDSNDFSSVLRFDSNM